MKKLFIKGKVYFDRARMYISYAQTLVVFLTFVKVFGFQFTILQYGLICSGLVSACIIVGWLDTKLGFFEAEQRRITELNPIMMELLKKMDEDKK